MTNYINAYDCGVQPNSSDVGPGLMVAWKAALSANQALFIPPGHYRFSTPVDWTSPVPISVAAEQVWLDWQGGACASCVTYGGVPSAAGPGSANYQTFKRASLKGLNITSPNTAIPRTGLTIQNVSRCNIDVLVTGFQRGILLACRGNPLMYNQFACCVSGDPVALEIDCDGSVASGACANRNSVHDSQVMGQLYAHGWNCDGWAWDGISSEGSYAWLKGANLKAWTFADGWFEGALDWALTGDNDIVIRGGRTAGLKTPYPTGVRVAT